MLRGLLGMAIVADTGLWSVVIIGVNVGIEWFEGCVERGGSEDKVDARGGRLLGSGTRLPPPPPSLPSGPT